MEKDDISIKDFFKYCKQVIDFGIALIKGTIQLILRNFITALVLMILVAAIGYVSGDKGKEYYEAGITCTYNDLHRKSYGEMILELNQCVKGNQPEALANALKIDLKTASSIQGVKAVNVAGSPLHEDLSVEKLPFYIKYQLEDPSFASTINQALLSYLQQCDYNAIRRKIRLLVSQERIGFLNHQIGQLDSLKASYRNYFEKGRNTTTEPVDIKVENLYKEAETLFTNKQDQEWTLQLDNSVEIIYQQIPLRIKASSNKIPRAIIGALIGIVLALGVAIYREKYASEA